MLPAGDEQLHFEFHRNGDGESIDLVASPGFKGKNTCPSVPGNAHVGAWRKGGHMIADQLAVGD